MKRCWKVAPQHLINHTTANAIATTSGKLWIIYIQYSIYTILFYGVFTALIVHCRGLPYGRDKILVLFS